MGHCSTAPTPWPPQWRASAAFKRPGAAPRSAVERHCMRRGAEITTPHHPWPHHPGASQHKLRLGHKLRLCCYQGWVRQKARTPFESLRPGSKVGPRWCRTRAGRRGSGPWLQGRAKCAAAAARLVFGLRPEAPHQAWPGAAGGGRVRSRGPGAAGGGPGAAVVGGGRVRSVGA